MKKNILIQITGAMATNIEESHKAMLEGNRDEVLRQLKDTPPTDEVLWLMAQAVVSEDDRYQALRDLVARGDSRISGIASQILDREEEFVKQLSEPPDYQFWKQTTWKDRLRKMRQFRIWLLGGLLLMILAVVGISLNMQSQSQEALTIAAIKLTQTAVALDNQTTVTFAAGTLQLLQIEYPTSRLVTFGEQNDNNFVAAAPAAGANFAAVRLQFVCSLALCANPPEAELRLLMTDGQVVSYENNQHPFLIGEPPMSRIAQGQSVQAWYVFEVPQDSTPDAIWLITGDDETPQIINWKNP